MTPDPQEQAPDLDVIEKYCDAAEMWTPEECEMKVDEEDGYIFVPQGATIGETLITLGDTYENSGNDWNFVARARTDLPALVKYTRSLQARLAEAERGSKCYCAVCRTAELLKDPPVDSTLP